MQDFAGKVAVVTGGASGIGLGMATRFAAEGMRLVLADIEEGALEAAAQGLRASGAEVLAVQTDAGDAASMDNLGARTLDHYGAVHIVCNNAGVGTHGRMWELSVNDWEFVLRVNLWGVIHGVRVFAPHLIEQDEGHIVNTASMAGLVSVAGAGPYNVSKHGAVTLSETLSAELRDAGSNVGVSVLCPGLVATNLGASERNRPADLRELDPRKYGRERSGNRASPSVDPCRGSRRSGWRSACWRRSRWTASTSSRTRIPRGRSSAACATSSKTARPPSSAPPSSPATRSSGSKRLDFLWPGWFERPSQKGMQSRPFEGLLINYRGCATSATCTR